MRPLIGFVLIVCALPPMVIAADRITLRDEEGTRVVTGEVLVEDAQGGCLLLTTEGHLVPCSASKIEHRESTDEAFKATETERLGKQLLEEFGPGFSLYRTEHYLVVHNTNEAYVKWCAGLFERLHRAFYVFWKTRDWQLQPSRFPLVAVVFNRREAFEQYARPELGDSVGSIIGYYNLQSNRITTYAMANPERNVATVVHEAAHQMAYNSGLQTRMADNPLWVSEGLAVYFESPDLSNSRGWRTLGKVNEVNLYRFRKYLSQRPNDSLQSLLINDRRFSGADAEAAYGESWALNYYLLKTRSKDYVRYLQRLAARRPLEAVDPQRRLNDFSECFGDLATFDAEFIKYMQRVTPDSK